MEDEIIIDRGAPTIMKLDQDEQALMDEIQISPPQRPIPVRRPVERTPSRPQRSNFDDEVMDAFVNPNKQSAPAAPPIQTDEVDYDEDEDMYQYDDTSPEYDDSEQPSKGYKTIDDEKADLINKLGRLEKKGFAVNKRLNAYSPIDDLRNEVKRITYSIDVDQSVRFSRRMLIACVTGLEFLNKRYNPFEIQLDGWSESVMENVDDYDGVFEELYVKYRSKVNVAPEVKLIMMLGGSAMMFHLTNSMFKSVMPNMNDVIKQNPDLVKSMMSAVQNTTRAPTGTPAADAPVGGTGQYEMKGPGIDISSLMGGISMPPPPPMSSSAIPAVSQEPPVMDDDDDDISDIISVAGESTGGEVKEVKVDAKKTRTRRKKKTEINL